MKTNQFLRILFLAFIFVLSSHGLCDRLDNPEYLTLTISCPNKNIKYGDKIPIVFTITNNGKLTWSFDGTDGDRSGRMPYYILTAKYKDGTDAKDPREGWDPGLMGGLSGGDVMVPPGMTFNMTIDLNLWVLIDKPGRYTVSGIFHGSCRNYPDYSTNPEAISDWIELKLDSEPIEITVNLRTDEEMGEYIEGLLQKLEMVEDSNELRFSEKKEQRGDILERLAFTCDSRTAPLFIDLMYNWDRRGDGIEIFVLRYS